MSEHFNNDVLERYAEEDEHTADCPCDYCEAVREEDAEWSAEETG